MAKTITVQWDLLEEYQQDLVVAMLNNTHGLEDYRHQNSIGGTPQLWCEATVQDCRHGWFAEGEAEQEVEDAIWDAGFERTSTGHLKGSGARGPSGSGGNHSIVFPLDIKIELGSYVS